MKKPLTAKQAADLLKVSTARIRQLCIEGKLRGAFKLTRDWLIPERSVKERGEKWKH